MIEIRRTEDDELCGHVVEHDGTWRALAVFGGELGRYDTRDEAVQLVLDDGLASLAAHWHYRSEALPDWQIVCIQEASPASVRIALDYYSMPGVPTLTLRREDLDDGHSLVLRP
ncbi:MAG: hypothetical protein WCC60_05605 [Ilumatobacteraceae bacterium]